MMATNYSDIGPQLIEFGYSITPVAGKAPVLPGWQNRPADAENFKRFAKHNVGILCGGEHNIVAVDVDVLNPFCANELETMIVEELGVSPKRVGKAPKFLLLYRCTENRRKVKTSTYNIDHADAAVEMLGEGNQFVGYGIHPDTQEDYYWPGDDMTDYTVNDLTIVTPQQLDAVAAQADHMLSLYGPAKQGLTRTAPTQNNNVVNMRLRDLSAPADEMNAAFENIDNDDLHYDDWIKGLHAIKGALGEDGKALAHQFSAKSDKYDEGVTETKWNSITNVRDIGAGSIRHWAGKPPTTRNEGPAEVKKSESALLQVSEIRGPVADRKWLLDEWFPAQAVSMLFGPGGVGKTLLVQQLGNCVAQGKPFFDIECRRMPVLAVLCEDDALEISRRQLAINEWMQVGFGGTGPDNMFIWPRIGEDNVMVTFPNAGMDEPGEFYGKLNDAVVEVKERTKSDEIFLILDTAADMYGGNENVRRETNTFLKTYVGSFCVNHNASVLVLAHPSVAGMRDGTGMSGSTAWENSVRSRAYFHKADEHDDVRVLSRKKSNYSSSGDTHDITVLWDQGVYQLPTLPDQVDRIHNNVLRQRILDEVEAAFIDGAAYRMRSGRLVKAALPRALNANPKHVLRLFAELEQDGYITMIKDKGYTVVKR